MVQLTPEAPPGTSGRFTLLTYNLLADLYAKVWVDLGLGSHNVFAEDGMENQFHRDLIRCCCLSPAGRLLQQLPSVVSALAVPEEESFEGAAGIQG